MRGVVPVAHPGKVAVGAGLAGVLRGRLAVHLAAAGARPADHAAQQVEVVDLARRPPSPGSTGRSPAAPSTAAARRCRASSAASRISPAGDVADRGDPLGRVRLRRLARARRSRWCARRRSRVDPAVARSSRAGAVHQRQVGAVAQRKVNVGLRATGVGRGRRTSSARRVGPGGGRASASTARSGSRRSCGPRARSRRSGRRRCRSRVGRPCRSVAFSAAAAVAVHSRVLPSMCGVPMPALPITRERVVLLEEQLAARVEPEATPPAGLRRAAPASARRCGPSPCPSRSRRARRPRARAAASAGRRMVGLPAEEVLRIEPAAVDAVDGAAAHTDDAAVLDRDVERVAVGVQDRRGLHPPFDVGLVDPGGEMQVDATRPGSPRPYGVRAPHGSAIRSIPCPITLHPQCSARRSAGTYKGSSGSRCSPPVGYPRPGAVHA